MNSTEGILKQVTCRVNGSQFVSNTFMLEWIQKWINVFKHNKLSCVQTTLMSYESKLFIDLKCFGVIIVNWFA